VADKLDWFLKDFVTNNLDAKINAKKAELSARRPSENIGGTHIHSNIAPQEALYIRLDSNETLHNMIELKRLFPDMWRNVDPLTRAIIKERYCNGGKSWVQLADYFNYPRQTLEDKYKKFKSEIDPWIYWLL
jgi:hypothetical protein